MQKTIAKAWEMLGKEVPELRCEPACKVDPLGGVTGVQN